MHFESLCTLHPRRESMRTKRGLIIPSCCDHWPEYALASFLFTYCRMELVVVTTVTLPSLAAVLRVDHGATCCLGPGCISLMSDAPGAGKNKDCSE